MDADRLRLLLVSPLEWPDSDVGCRGVPRWGARCPGPREGCRGSSHRAGRCPPRPGALRRAPARIRNGSVPGRCRADCGPRRDRPRSPCWTAGPGRGELPRGRGGGYPRRCVGSGREGLGVRGARRRRVLVRPAPTPGCVQHAPDLAPGRDRSAHRGGGAGRRRARCRVGRPARAPRGVGGPAGGPQRDCSDGWQRDPRGGRLPQLRSPRPAVRRARSPAVRSVRTPRWPPPSPSGSLGSRIWSGACCAPSPRTAGRPLPCIPSGPMRRSPAPTACGTRSCRGR